VSLCGRRLTGSSTTATVQKDNYRTTGFISLQPYLEGTTPAGQVALWICCQTASLLLWRRANEWLRCTLTTYRPDRPFFFLPQLYLL